MEIVKLVIGSFIVGLFVFFSAMSLYIIWYGCKVNKGEKKCWCGEYHDEEWHTRNQEIKESYLNKDWIDKNTCGT